MKKNNETVTKLRTGDEVVVIAGKDIGKKGTVQKISKFNNKVVITGINMIKKHTKPATKPSSIGRGPRPGDRRQLQLALCSAPVRYEINRRFHPPIVG